MKRLKAAVDYSISLLCFSVCGAYLSYISTAHSMHTMFLDLIFSMVMLLLAISYL